MTVTLRPLREDELPAYLATAEVSYARQMTELAGLSPAVAAAKARRDLDRLLPQGLATPGVDVLVVEDDGVPVGHAVLGAREREGIRYAFVYDVEIDAAYRGRGFGRAAMVCLEDLARTRGLGTIELNVFGGNEVARGLYRSLGYEEAAVTMAKQL